jgi:hypothetical protein
MTTTFCLFCENRGIGCKNKLKTLETQSLSAWAREIFHLK